MNPADELTALTEELGLYPEQLGTWEAVEHKVVHDFDLAQEKIDLALRVTPL